MIIAIRPATSADRSICVALLNQLSEATDGAVLPGFDSAFDELLKQNRGLILIAEEGQQILGMASISFNLALRYGGDYCQLEELIVSPEARGKQIGAQLMNRAGEIATERGCGEFGLYLLESTEHNRPFYEKFGFTAIGTEMRQALGS